MPRFSLEEVDDQPDVEALVRAAATAYGVDPEHMAKLAKQESGFDQGAVSKKGAVGVMQLMPATAKGLGVDPSDLYDNINGGVRYYRGLLKRFGGDKEKATAAYNAGPEAVTQNKPLPTETRQYVSAITGKPAGKFSAADIDQPAAAPVGRFTAADVEAASPGQQLESFKRGENTEFTIAPEGRTPPRPTHHPAIDYVTSLKPPADLPQQAVIPGMEDQVNARPGPARPPLPPGLSSEEQLATQEPVRRNPRTGLPMTPTPQGTGPLGITDYPLLGAEKIIAGVEQAAEQSPPTEATGRRNPRTGQVMKGSPLGSEQAAGIASILSGAMQATAPLLPGAVVAAPASTAATLFAGTVADIGVSKGLKALGVSDEYADLAGSIAAILAGYAASHARLTREQLTLAETIRGGEPGGADRTVEALKATVDRGGTQYEREIAQAILARKYGIKYGAPPAAEASPQPAPTPEAAPAPPAEPAAPGPQAAPEPPLPAPVEAAAPPPGTIAPTEPPAAAPPSLPALRKGSSFDLPEGRKARIVGVFGNQVTYLETDPQGKRTSKVLPLEQFRAMVAPVVEAPAAPLSVSPPSNQPLTPQAEAAPSGAPPLSPGSSLPSSVPEAQGLPVEPPTGEPVQGVSEVVPGVPEAPQALNTGLPENPPSVPEAAVGTGSRDIGAQTQEPERKFSSTQANITGPVADAAVAFGKQIPDDKLAADGRESEAHVTVKYGLHGNDPEEVRVLLASEPPITATLAKASLFQNDDADVLKVDVDSPDLHRLNKKIADALPTTDAHPEYKPHLTIAYLKPGEGKQYAGKPIPGVTGETVTLPSVTFSGQDGKTVDIPLSGAPPEAAPAPQPSELASKHEPEGQIVQQKEEKVPTGEGVPPSKEVIQKGAAPEVPEGPPSQPQPAKPLSKEEKIRENERRMKELQEELRKRKPAQPPSPALNPDIEEEALRAWAESRAYIDSQGNYHLKGPNVSGPIAPWNRAIKGKYKTSKALHDAAQKYKVGTAEEAPTPTAAAMPAKAGWLGTLPEAQRESVFDVMRKVEDDATRLMEEHNKLRPKYGEVAVGGAHIDPMVQAFGRQGLLRALRQGKTVDEAVAAGKADAHEAVQKFNEKVKGPQAFQIHRPEGLADSALEQIGRNLREAGGKAEPAKPTEPTKPEFVETIPADNPDVSGGYTVNRWPGGQYQVKHFSKGLGSTFGSNFPTLEAARDMVKTWKANYQENEKVAAEIRKKRLEEKTAKLKAENEKLKGGKAVAPAKAEPAKAEPQPAAKLTNAQAPKITAEQETTFQQAYQKELAKYSESRERAYPSKQLMSDWANLQKDGHVDTNFGNNHKTWVSITTTTRSEDAGKKRVIVKAYQLKMPNGTTYSFDWENATDNDWAAAKALARGLSSTNERASSEPNSIHGAMMHDGDYVGYHEKQYALREALQAALPDAKIPTFSTITKVPKNPTVQDALEAVADTLPRNIDTGARVAYNGIDERYVKETEAGLKKYEDQIKQVAAIVGSDHPRVLELQKLVDEARTKLQENKAAQDKKDAIAREANRKAVEQDARKDAEYYARFGTTDDTVLPDLWKYARLANWPEAADARTPGSGAAVNERALKEFGIEKKQLKPLDVSGVKLKKSDLDILREAKLDPQGTGLPRRLSIGQEAEWKARGWLDEPGIRLTEEGERAALGVREADAEDAVGRPMSQYKPGSGKVPDPHEFRFALNVPIPHKGDVWHTQGYFLVLGPPPKYWTAPKELGPGEKRTLPDVGRVIPAKKGEEIKPVGFAVNPTKGLRGIFFSNGESFDSVYFDYVNKTHAPDKWTSEGMEKPAQAWKGGKLVAVVMPMRWGEKGNPPPPGIAKLLPKSKEAPAPAAESITPLASRVDEEGTSAFKKWFGASKAVDENGDPVRVYHGTAADFKDFSPENIEAEGGFFFTDSRGMAARWASAKHRGFGVAPGANVRPAYLSLQNPLIVDMEGKPKYQGFDQLIARARSEKRDGVIVRNVDDGPGFYDPMGGIPNDVYIAFEPGQIKPAFGGKLDVFASRIPKLSGEPAQTFITGAPDSFHAFHMRFEEFPLEGQDAENAAVFATNPNGIEFIYRLAGRAEQGPNVLALHLSPKDAGRVAQATEDKMRGLQTPGKPAGGKRLESMAELAELAWDAHAQAKSLILMSDLPGISDVEKSVALQEELDHAAQGRLSGAPQNARSHMGSLAMPFAHSGLGLRALRALEKRGYQFDERHRPGEAAAEIGVRLMAPGRYKQLDLSPEEARSLAARYVRLLRKEHGTAKPREIAGRVFDSLRKGRGEGQPGVVPQGVSVGRGGGAPEGTGPALPPNRPGEGIPASSVSEQPRTEDQAESTPVPREAGEDRGREAVAGGERPPQQSVVTPEAVPATGAVESQTVPRKGGPGNNPLEKQPQAPEGKKQLPTAAEVLAWLKKNSEVADDHDSLAIRLQSAPESQRTKAGSKLRPSHEWVDGAKTNRKLPGTAGFSLPYKPVAEMTEADLQPILRAMEKGYSLRNPGDRLVLIGSNEGSSGSDMPERYATALKNAELIDVFPSESTAQHSPAALLKTAAGEAEPHPQIVQNKKGVEGQNVNAREQTAPGSDILRSGGVPVRVPEPNLNVSSRAGGRISNARQSEETREPGGIGTAAEGNVGGRTGGMPTPGGVGGLREGVAEFVKGETGSSSVGPAFKTLASDIRGDLARANHVVHVATDDILKLLAPAAREGAKEAALSVRNRAAELARKTAIADKALGAGRNALNKLTPQQRWDFYDRAENGEPEPNSELKAIANLFRKLLDAGRKDVQDLGTGKLEKFIENYLPHIYKDPKKAEQVFASYYGKRPLEGSKSFLKRRHFETLKDAMEAGLEPVSDNPVDMVLLKLREMQKYVMAHRILNDLKGEGVVKYVKAGSQAPQGYQRIDDKIATVFGPRMGAVTLPEDAEISPEDVGVPGVRIMGQYWAPEPAARVVNNYLSPGLREKSVIFRGYLAMANAMNQFQLGFSAFHLSFTTVDAATSKFALGIYQAAHGHPIKGIVSAVQTPLAPFTGIVKGDKMLKEYYQPGSQGDQLASIVNAMVIAGGRARMDKFYETQATSKMRDNFRRMREAASEFRPKGVVGNALAGALRAPFALAEQASRPILEYVVPRQKMAVFADLAQFELERLAEGRITPEEFQVALARAWDSVDNRMGQLVYDNLFWNKMFKDLLMGSVRSVGWNTGTIREILGGAGDIPKALKGDMSPRLSYLIALPIVLGMMGYVTYYLWHGKPPKTLADCYLIPDAKNVLWWLPSYMKDIISTSVEGPFKVAKGKLHPALTGIVSMLQNRDYFDRPIRNTNDPIVMQMTEFANWAIQQMAPISLKPPPSKRQPNRTLQEKILPEVGVTRVPAGVAHPERKYGVFHPPNEKSPYSGKRLTY